MVDDILQGKDSKAKNDFIFLLHNLVHGMGQAIIHGDTAQKDVLAKQMVDDILQGKDSKAKNDFIFLLHNLVHGMGQAIIHGDKEQKDYFYGYGDRRPYYHHHYYGDNYNNDDWRVWGETDNNKDHFYNGDHHGY